MVKTHSQKLKQAAQVAKQSLSHDEIHEVFCAFTAAMWYERSLGHNRKAERLQVRRNVIAAKLGYWPDDYDHDAHGG